MKAQTNQLLSTSLLTVFNRVICSSFTDVNECFEFDLTVTGLKPARVETSAVCHIMHHPKPVSLAVMVTFKVGKPTKA